jgi:sporulation protein YlmC with PRC-barrel domain
LAYGLAPATAQSYSELDRSGDQQLDEREFEQISRRTFDTWDANADRRMSQREFHDALFAAMDGDSDNRLTQEEYRSGARGWFDQGQQPQFSSLDADGDGIVSEQEFDGSLQDANLLTAWDEQPEGGLDWAAYHAALFDLYDRDGNDQVTQRDLDDIVLVFLAETGGQQASNPQTTATDTTMAASQDGQMTGDQNVGSINRESAISAEEVIALQDWQMDDVYTNGLSVDNILDETEVHGIGGEEIGSVENIVFSRDGRVLSVIAEVGGFWDMFDTHVNVPWDEVAWNGSGEIVIPVTEENVEDYSVFKTDYLMASEAGEDVQLVEEDLATGMRAFRATDLMGDYARIRADDRLATYGYVNDLIIQDGTLHTVVVTPETGYGVTGRYGYPYYGLGWSPTSNYYDMPYDRTQVIQAQQVDYDRFTDG